jgi:hypothetical protein
MTDNPTIWRDMTAEEKGALLLAHHEGKVIQLFDKADLWFDIEDPEFADGCAYRVKPEPTVETVTMAGGDGNGWGFYQQAKRAINHTHRITFDLIDGDPDPSTIRMEKLK